MKYNSLQRSDVPVIVTHVDQKTMGWLLLAMGAVLLITAK
ncbi:hypothetical protein SAMN05444369_11049 [Capnocytophaga haemolytica]|uniref:Uncharacterized protein n=1 Tax=Capnocytophaga haemolytica TaxID=45243 RepID=A0AAX2GUD0_9FLAO|nr:hypothetical protein SAMN05444369_11049 [Capnocytophaga haemolytica]SNV01876.1 Uncharacterised protein [Capnocytophaga haemolytica]